MVESVYARHDFIPMYGDEIPFRAGERIEVIEKDEVYGDGWWKVCLCSFRSPLINSTRSLSPRIRGTFSSQAHPHFFLAASRVSKSQYPSIAFLPYAPFSFILEWGFMQMIR